MPLIVGGSALPTDKPIIGASGEIHKVVAKNGDVIWEMSTGLPKGGKMKLDATHYWEIEKDSGSTIPIRVVWDGQEIPLKANHYTEFRVHVGEVTYMKGNVHTSDGKKFELVKILNGYSYYQNADGAEKLFWSERGTPVNKIHINELGRTVNTTDATEISNAIKSNTYEDGDYKYYKGDFVKHKNGINYYFVGRVKL